MKRRRVQTSVSLSLSLRRRIEAACAESGRTRSAEVEARLRASFDLQGGDGLLLLKIDDGLMAWLRALVAGPGFWGDLQQTSVYLMRSDLQRLLKHDVWYGATVAHLPSPIREANMRSPKYQALVKAAA